MGVGTSRGSGAEGVDGIRGIGAGVGVVGIARLTVVGVAGAGVTLVLSGGGEAVKTSSSASVIPPGGVSGAPS